MRIIFFLTLYFSFLSVSYASPYLINIKGKKKVTVTSKNVRLVDIASVESVEDDIETQLAMQRLIIELSPKPGKEKVITAARVLERLRESNVDLQKVGYALPRLIKVQRAKRMLKKQEVKQAIETYLFQNNEELEIRTHDYRREIAITPKAKIIEVSKLISSKPGRKKFELLISDNNDYQQSITVSAFVDVFREVPVSVSKLERGNIITEGDIAYARLNTRNLPRDYVSDVKRIIGYEIKNSLNPGQPFKLSKISVPKIIKNGDSVVLEYKTKNLLATATGKAIQSGGLGEEIKVRNSSSGKVIKAEVLGEGLVGVVK